MPFITVSKGGPTTQIEDGVYTVTLTDIEGPRTVTAQRGPRAGEDIDLLDWKFAINDGQPHAGEIVEASTSTASGPRSKLYGFLVALFGGKAPPPGTELEKGHLVGREAIATIRTDEGGWPRIENLGAVPKTAPMNVVGTAIPKEEPKPLAEVPPAKQPVAAGVASADDDLPF